MARIRRCFTKEFKTNVLRELDSGLTIRDKNESRAQPHIGQILHEALDLTREKKLISRAPLSPGEDIP